MPWYIYLLLRGCFGAQAVVNREQVELERLVHGFRNLARPTSGSRRLSGMHHGQESGNSSVGLGMSFDALQRTASDYDDLVSEADETESMADDSEAEFGYSDRGSSVPSRIFTDFSQRDFSTYGGRSIHGGHSVKAGSVKWGSFGKKEGPGRNVTVLPSISDSRAQGGDGGVPQAQMRRNSVVKKDTGLERLPRISSVPE